MLVSLDFDFADRLVPDLYTFGTSDTVLVLLFCEKQYVAVELRKIQLRNPIPSNEGCAASSQSVQHLLPQPGSQAEELGLSK